MCALLLLLLLSHLCEDSCRQADVVDLSPSIIKRAHVKSQTLEHPTFLGSSLPPASLGDGFVRKNTTNPKRL